MPGKGNVAMLFIESSVTTSEDNYIYCKFCHKL